MLDTTQGLRVVGTDAEEIRPRPFPHEHSADCKFFVFRDGLYLHCRYTNDGREIISWEQSTRYSDEYLCEDSGFFDSAEEAQRVLNIKLTQEAVARAIRRPQICETPPLAALVAP